MKLQPKISIFALFSLLISSSALAATIQVGTTADADGGASCSLRDAISSLNNLALQGGCANSSGDGFGINDTVVLPSGIYTLTVSGSPNDDNSSGDLDILVDMAIVGADPNNPLATTIDAAGLSPRDRVFDIVDSMSLNATLVTMDALNIVNGLAPDNTTTDDPNGGGIRIGLDNSLEITNSRVADNAAGNGTSSASSFTGTGGYGGGIYQAGPSSLQSASLRVFRTLIEGNRTGNAVVPNTVPTAGNEGGYGGGIFAVSELTVEESVIRNNATGNGALGNTVGGSGGRGGGIAFDDFIGTAMVVSRSTVSGNTTGNGGDAVNTSGGAGGHGGGIFVSGGSGIQVDHSTISGNTTGNGGVAGSTSGGTGGLGGGIYVQVQIPRASLAPAGLSSIFAVLENNTVSGNTTGNGGGAGVFGGDGGDGGGVYVSADEDEDGSVQLNNNTIVLNQTGVGGVGPNSVGDGGDGGGINVPSVFTEGNGPLFSVNLANNIVANNQVGTDGDGINCDGNSLVDDGYNLESETDCNFINNGLQNTAPMLEPLADNGGPTQTHALLLGSPAMEAGNPGAAGSGYPNCASDDQRGVTRPQGARCDIGAYEAQVADLAVLKTVAASPVDINETIVFTITVTNNGPTGADLVTLEDTLPAEVNFISATPDQGTCLLTGQTLACDLGTVASGDAVAILLEASSATPGDYVNTATVASTALDPDPSNNTSSIAFAVVASGGGALIEGGGCQLGRGEARFPSGALAATLSAFALVVWRQRRIGRENWKTEQIINI